MVTAMANVLLDRPVITVAEVSHALRVSPMTVYRLIKTGELKAFKVGRAFRIYEDSYADYLQSHSEG
jgi:excisionase family DNA binding protein